MKLLDISQKGLFLKRGNCCSYDYFSKCLIRAVFYHKKGPYLGHKMNCLTVDSS